MRPFHCCQPTEIYFGAGRLGELGPIARRFGGNLLLVTGRGSTGLAPNIQKLKKLLEASGVRTIHFDGVVPNPTTEVVSAGAVLARTSDVRVVMGFGGGSSMDVAKAIAVEAVHEGSSWDYLYYKKEPTAATLPVIAVPTTAGTGSQVTACSVITRVEEQDKSALCHPNLFPKVAVVDSELTLDLPRNITAMTGFDALAHNFEAYISTASNVYAETLALEGLRAIVRWLPVVLEDGYCRDGRDAMAWAGTLGGLCIAGVGVTLPHGLGTQIGGHCPWIAHGQALAAVYPECTRYTWEYSVEKFAVVARIFNPSLGAVPDAEAAAACCEEIDLFIGRIGLDVGLRALGVDGPAIRRIANAGKVLPDYRNNPRVPNIEEMYGMLSRSMER